MKICHVCAAECQDDAELCPVCGAEFLNEDIAELSNDVITLQNPVLAASVEDVVTAEIYRDMLRENGIVYTCDESEDNNSMKVVFGGGFVAEDIYVDEKDLEAAKQIYLFCRRLIASITTAKFRKENDQFGMLSNTTD